MPRAYRRAARKWHPDKSVATGLSAAVATQKFILVSKAYETLTDPAKMETFQRYGNPDGPQYVKEW